LIARSTTFVEARPDPALGFGDAEFQAGPNRNTYALPRAL
jgi:hypothetical protein